MRHAATPGEVQRLHDYLAPLPEHRREPIVSFLTEIVGDCPDCEGPARRCDPRVLRAGRLCHLVCGGEVAENGLESARRQSAGATR